MSDPTVPDTCASPIGSLLFDLDGTLADTAPDLAYALNRVLEAEGHTALSFERIRPVVSHGSQGLIRLGFGIDEAHPDFQRLRRELLDIYQDHLARETCLFPGMESLLTAIEARGLRWGVVTNKPGWLTEPLLDALALDRRAACIVSGDTLEQRKPHPAPLLHACRLTGCDAPRCVYIGDAERDIAAGRAAGMHTLVALFGYLGEDDRPETWGADGLVRSPEEILAWLDSQRREG
ncbi:MAG TPA: phosphoglycolate phosphatase [Gammaproteobacteria bacterium]|nr:phosphoglycolate phosphatase [Gammaproteobacteria bacterium]